MLSLLFGAALVLASSAWPQGRADAPSDPTFHAVSYVEVAPASTAAATTAIKQYRDASRQQQGFVRLEFFDQVGRPGHFVVVETWRDQTAFDGRGAVQQQLLDKLQAIRISGYDQRPYKTLTVAAAPAPATTRSLVVVSHVDVNQDPRVPPMLRRLAETSRAEDGNVRFDIMQHMMRANHFTVVEIWRDQRAFDAHVAAAHTKQYRDEVQPLTGSPLDERVYRIVD